MAIRNRVYRACAKAGFNARIQAELAQSVPEGVPLHSHHATRQNYFQRGWQSVSAIHILRAKAAQSMAAQPNK